MFVLDQSNEYVWPVELDMATASGPKRVVFNGHFKRVPQSEADRLAASVRRDMEIIDAVFTGWDGIEAEPGKPLEVTPENRAQLLDTTQIVPSIVLAWFASLQGGVRKN